MFRGIAALLGLCGLTACCPSTVIAEPGSPSFVGLDSRAVVKLEAADLEARALRTDQDLRALLGATAGLDHRSDPDELKKDSGSAVFDKVASKYPATTAFERGSFWPWSSAVAEDGASAVIRINPNLVDERSVEDYTGTIWHELAHEAGYRHDGNARRGNECTVPHVIGDAAVLVAAKRATGAWGALPSDACKGLVAALATLAK